MNSSEGRSFRIKSPTPIGLLVFIFAVVIACGVALIVQNRSSQGWQTVHIPYSFGADRRGNIALIDVERNGVSILVTGRAGQGGVFSATETHFAVEIPDTDFTVDELALERKLSGQRLEVSRQRNRLCILMPDGREDAFRIPRSFSKRIGDFDIERESYLSQARELLRDTDERSRLEDFLSAFDEPEPRPTEADNNTGA